MSSVESMPPVLEVIQQRAETGSNDDGFKVGLAVEGGGLRGIVSGSMLIALRDLGYEAVFDAYCGTSSGTTNIAYFLAGAGYEALAFYYDYFTRKEFYSPRRYASRQPAVDMNYIFDHVMDTEIPLDYDKLLALPSGKFNVAVSNIDSLEGEIYSSFSSKDDVRNRLKASCWLPIIAGKPFTYQGVRYLDSGLLYPDPLYVGLELDPECTHIMVLNTECQTPHTGSSNIPQWTLSRLLNEQGARLGHDYYKRRRQWAALENQITYGETQVGNTQVYRLAPSVGSHAIKRFTMDKGILLDGARVGYEAVFDAFDVPNNIRFGLVNVQE